MKNLSLGGPMLVGNESNLFHSPVLSAKNKLTKQKANSHSHYASDYVFRSLPFNASQHNGNLSIT